jgi:hypothetical protein
MAWFKVDDGFYTSMKFLSIPRQHQAQAAGAWLLCGTWSADKMTDGFVPYSVMDMWEFEADVVGHLVEVGLWDHDEERMGIQFHDWCDYQPTRDELMEKRNRRAEVNSANAKKRWEKSKNDASVMQEVCETDANTMQNDAPVPEPVPEPLEVVVVKPTRKTELQPDWKPSSAGYEYAKQRAPGMNADIQAEKFVNYNLTQGRKLGDWEAAWRNWVLKAIEFDPLLAQPLPPPKRQFTGEDYDDDI